MTKLKTVALYLRVSTGEQTVENQRRELLAAAERRGWTVAAEFCDEGISGANGRDKRPAFDKLCRAVVRHQFDVVAAWSVDRLGRSVQDLVAFLGELHGAGVDLYLDRQGVDTSTPAGKALLQMWASSLSSNAASSRNALPPALPGRARRVPRAGRPSAGQRYPPSARTLYGHPWRPGRASARRRGCAGQAMRPWLGSRPRCADR
jgi:Resolvase, N terminal domain